MLNVVLYLFFSISYEKLLSHRHTVTKQVIYKM